MEFKWLNKGELSINLKNQYNKTIIACFIGYIVQAIVNNFVPLLFLTFERLYEIPLTQITLLVTINFGTQFLVDLLSVLFVDKIGYRISMVIAHLFSALGLILITILPEVIPIPFWGLFTGVVIYAIGGGLLEVLVSPVVEACPSNNKEKTMSMLHSFYCWGHVGVVVISTIFFHVLGIKSWRILTIFWAIIPLFNAYMFTKISLPPILSEIESTLKLKDLFRMKPFWILFIMMVCAGASEQSVSQWASTFAEQGLRVTKSVGDLSGPMTFAVMMGISRSFYGQYGDKIDLDQFMIFSSILCILSYLGISLIPIPVASLIACAICGLSVGVMWPGTFSKASATLSKGGTSMFALLALGGDIGCSIGPTLVGIVSSVQNNNLKIGILVASIFPFLLLLGILHFKKIKIGSVK